MITIVDYGMGNLGSVVNMFKKVGAEARLSSDPAEIGRATKLVLPGVGAFGKGMEALEARGLVPVLNERVLGDRVPMLGLCLGAQLFSSSSEEGERPGLGWIEGRTVRFRFGPEHADLKIPHMGWNTVRVERPHPVVSGLPEDARFYFVHSYHIVASDPCQVLLTAEYGIRLVAGVVRDNIVGVQFHPEKSHRFGMQLFRNFVALA